MNLHEFLIYKKKLTGHINRYSYLIIAEKWNTRYMGAGKLKNKKLNIVYRLYELLNELLRTFMTYFTVRVSLYVYTFAANSFARQDALLIFRTDCTNVGYRSVMW